MATAGNFPKVAGDTIYAADINQLKRIPQKIVGAYTLLVADVGMHVFVSSTVTVPDNSSGIQAGDAISIFNGSGSPISFASTGSPLSTYKIAGTAITPITLAANGLATFLCVSTGAGAGAARYVVIGAGIT